MATSSLRASSSLFARVARTVSPVARRSFSAAAASKRPDIVQDLYLREVRAYKQPPMKATDAEGYVQKFNMPKAPRSPEEKSLSDQMQEYQDSTVEIEGQAAAGETPAEEDYFEDVKDIEDEQPAAH